MLPSEGGHASRAALSRWLDRLRYEIKWHKYTSLTERGKLLERKRPRSVSYEALGLSSVAGDHVAFLEMYIDESYGSPNPSIVVAGFVSHIDLWAQFAQAWQKEILERYRIPFLHMAELWNPNAAVYRHLKPEEHDEIFSTAKAVILNHVQIGVGCVINRSEFDAIATAAQRSKFGTDYTLGVRYCVTVIADELESLSERVTMSIFLEDGHRNTNQAVRLLKDARQSQQFAFDSIGRIGDRFIVWRDPERDSVRFNFGVIDTGTKTSRAPLQAADLLTFALLNEQNLQFHDTLNEFASGLSLLLGYYSRAGLKKTFAGLDEEENARRRQRRRFADVIREIKSTGGDIKKGDGGGYFLNFRDLASAEDRVTDRLGEERLTKSLQQGNPLFPSVTDIEVQCPRCDAKFILRGFEGHESFGCPLCEESIGLPLREY